MATAVGGIPELLEYGTAGLLSPPSDPEAMAFSFRTLMADSTILERWRARARDGAEHLTVRRMTEDYLDVYADVALSPAGVAVRPRARG